eukprot:scaffold32639_cov112-Isochrysis_galbana.AAC.1
MPKKELSKTSADRTKPPCRTRRATGSSCPIFRFQRFAGTSSMRSPPAATSCESERSDVVPPGITEACPTT